MLGLRVEAAPGGEAVRFAIGVWHLRAHQASCQINYNPRYMPGAGLVFGDNIEHLWPDMRKHGFVTAYMSPGARQDFLTQLVSASWDLIFMLCLITAD